MTDSQRYTAALAFASEKHSGQLRIGDDPYITHPVAVAEIVGHWGYGTDYQIAALFHDLLEDTDATEGQIEALGGRRVLQTVRLLTKQPGYVMSEYVAAIKADPMAKVIKAADRLHNLRCAVVASDDFKRRYIRETADWYLDLSPEILPALKALVQTMDTGLAAPDFLCDPVDRWLLQQK